MKKVFIILLGISFILTSCSPTISTTEVIAPTAISVPSITLSPVATFTIMPTQTFTLIPTATNTITSTPIPTSTPNANSVALSLKISNISSNTIYKLGYDKNLNKYFLLELIKDAETFRTGLVESDNIVDMNVTKKARWITRAVQENNQWREVNDNNIKYGRMIPDLFTGIDTGRYAIPMYGISSHRELTVVYLGWSIEKVFGEDYYVLLGGFRDASRELRYIKLIFDKVGVSHSIDYYCRKNGSGAVLIFRNSGEALRYIKPGYI